MPEGQETYVTAMVLGTFGYFDPEYTSVCIFLQCLICRCSKAFQLVYLDFLNARVSCRFVNYISLSRIIQNSLNSSNSKAQKNIEER